MKQITAKVICDSISDGGVRLTTFQLRYHRYIHGEFMTHRTFSRNASSSRAIPVAKVLAQVWSDPAIPVKWGSNQPGMQAGAELSGWRKSVARGLWKAAGKVACVFAWGFMKVGLAKEVANRILEPWQFINVVVTATDYGNFYILRDHKDAQPEIQVLAGEMKKALMASNPQVLTHGEWHLPYVTGDEVAEAYQLERPSLLPVLSAARCARVSYNLHDGSRPDEIKDINLFRMLAISKPAHASPLEHQAVVNPQVYRSRNFQGDWQQFREVLEVSGWGPYEPTGDTSAAD